MTTRSVGSSNQMGTDVEEIKAFANLAIIKDQYGEILEARNDFQRAIKMAEEIENVELLAFLYSELGVSFAYTNNLDRSEGELQKSFSLLRMKLKNNERLSYFSSNIGSLYLQISQLQISTRLLQQGIKVCWREVN
ncbi:MAG: hypothetical protein MZV64_24700 [Ignavibacteriales bacterium]|nr:hypothetical protein [Ignavibacteriales bacterium]